MMERKREKYGNGRYSTANCNQKTVTILELSPHCLIETVFDGYNGCVKLADWYIPGLWFLSS